MNYKSIVWILVLFLYTQIAIGSTTLTHADKLYYPHESLVIVRDNYNPAYSVELISNTPQCFDCETVYKITNRGDTGLFLSDIMFKLYDKYELETDTSYYIQILNNVTYHESIPQEGTCQYEETVIENITKIEKFRIVEYPCIESYKQEEHTKQVWESVSIKDLPSLMPEESILMKLKGHIGQGESVDNRVNLLGVEINEFAWWNNSWERCRDVTIPNVGSTTLHDFPAYIEVNWIGNMSPTFQDVRFVNTSCNSSGTPLQYELEYYNNSLIGYYWVKIEELPADGKTIAMYFNNSRAVYDGVKQQVWTNKFNNVWHLTNASDSTGNTSEMSMNNFDGNEWGNILAGGRLDIDQQDFLQQEVLDVDTLSEYCFSGWFNMSSSYIGSDAFMIMLDQATAYGVKILKWIDASTLYEWEQGDGVGAVDTVQTAILSKNEWHHVFITSVSGGDMRIYLDGLLSNVNNGGNTWANTDTTFWISGNGVTQWFGGGADEVRYCQDNRSANWVNETYQLMKDNTIVTFGGVEVYVPPGGGEGEGESELNTTQEILTQYEYDTIPNVLLLLVLILLWLGLLALGHVWGNELFIVAGYIVGVLVGFMFNQIHTLFMVVIVMLNIAALALMYLRNN